MIENVGSVTIFVRDQEKSKDFYTKQLGMELRRDEPMPTSNEGRWLAVAPPSSTTEIVLYPAGDEFWQHYESTIGKTQALTLTCSDLPATIRDLRARDVSILQDVQEEHWGNFAVIADCEQNSLIIIQPQAEK